MAEERRTESKPTRPESRDQRPRGRPGGGGRRFFRRKKVDYFSVNKIDDINYKDVDVLKQFIGDRGKILPRRHTGLGAMHQRKLKIAIKRARNIALLPFAGGSDSLRSPRVESKSAEAKAGGVTKAAETKADKPTSAESKAVETKADKPTSAESNPAAKSRDG
jgi:small subunit ribosomal protein S18